MSYNAKNYTEQGGDTTHFGGKVIFEEGCDVEGGSFTEVKTASETEKGIVKIGDGLDIDSEGEPFPAADDALGRSLSGQSCSRRRRHSFRCGSYKDCGRRCACRG